MIEYFFTKDQKSRSSQIKVFVSLCCYGHLSVAQWLYRLVEINIHCLQFGEAFVAACYNCHLSIAHCLVSLGNIRQDLAFRRACMNGQLSMIQMGIQSW